MVHVAIDDTYGSGDADRTKYVTRDRRTYVAVEFPDSQAEGLREGVRLLLQDLPARAGVTADEFHFTDIYNRRGPWKNCSEGSNLEVFSEFANLYREFQWTVYIQTVDDRTLADHGVTLTGEFDGIDLGSREGQALFFLLARLRRELPPPPEPLVVRVDEDSRRPPGTRFGSEMFREWGAGYDGMFESSASDPLVQIADFLAFSINRNTYLAMKNDVAGERQLTDIDWWFLKMFSAMGIRSDQLEWVPAGPQPLAVTVDKLHARDRRTKGLE